MQTKHFLHGQNHQHGLYVLRRKLAIFYIIVTFNTTHEKSTY